MHAGVLVPQAQDQRQHGHGVEADTGFERCQAGLETLVLVDYSARGRAAANKSHRDWLKTEFPCVVILTCKDSGIVGCELSQDAASRTRRKCYGARRGLDKQQRHQGRLACAQEDDARSCM